ncbi:MAG: (Fe-S)-binding protein [Peptococcaceae bacterium]|jgi:glycolate oxidase iron-sulfur subunit|nr:(Fe-S)-binding protein [Peptococcaceae bacterium]
MEATYRLDFNEELKKCVKCGTCRAHCPLFVELIGEVGSPRGRLSLIKLLQEQRIKPSQEIADIVYTCLLCKTCAVNCPSGVKVDEIVFAARDFLNRALGEGVMKKALLRGFLTRPGFLAACASLGALYQKIGLHSLLTKANLFDHLPEKIGAAGKILPDITKKPARKRVPTLTPAKGPRRFRVAYFLGCATNLAYPDVPVAGVEVLSQNGCEVITVEGVKCCGMPHLAYGDTETAAKLAKHNMEIFFAEEYDAIVCDCASCTSTFQESYIHLFEPGSKEYEMTKKLQTKAMDLTKFLVTKSGVRPGGKAQQFIVTYHDPCHLKRGQNVFKEPREILKSIPGIEFAEMKEADRCCGSAGSFTVMHHELSMKVLDKKIANVQKVEPDYVATCCPTCTMQLSYGLKKAGIRAKVVHPVQLLAESYK